MADKEAPKRRSRFVVVLLAVPLLCLLVFGIPPLVRYFSGEGAVQHLDAAELPTATVTPHLEVSHATPRNLVWCATFQFTWNELCDHLGEDIHMANEPPAVAVLNKKSAAKKDLDEASYYVACGRVKDSTIAKISRDMAAKFGVRPKSLPPRAGLDPHAVVAYAYLAKDLLFGTPFEPIRRPFVFADVPVAAFGVQEQKRGMKADEGFDEILKQVTVWDYEGPEDFVIELKSTSPGDRLILAKVRPAATLDATIRAVQARMSKAVAEELTPGDVLEVPKLNFDLRRSYDELCGRPLKLKNTPFSSQLMLLWAEQSIRFKLDEKGAELRSEASSGIACSKPSTPRPKFRLVFDKPFLLMLQRADSTRPYFVLWAGDATFMQKVEP